MLSEIAGLAAWLAADRGDNATAGVASPALTAAEPRVLATEALATGRAYASERITSRIRASRTTLLANTSKPATLTRPSPSSRMR